MIILNFLFYVVALNITTVFFFFLWRLLPPLTDRRSSIISHIMNIHFQINWHQGQVDPLPSLLIPTSDLSVIPAAWNYGKTGTETNYLYQSWRFSVQKKLHKILVVSNTLRFFFNCARCYIMTNSPSKRKSCVTEMDNIYKKKHIRAGYTGRYDLIHPFLN